MPLAPLATVADLQGRLGRVLDPTETTRAGLLLGDASAAVRAYTGQQFTAATTTARFAVRGNTVRLPQRPVTAVTAVKDTSGTAVGYSWFYGHTVTLTAGPWSSFVDITYSHGYAEIPGEIVGLVCNLVGRSMSTLPDETGYQSESIGTYSYSIGPAAASGPFGLLNDERAVLDRYRSVGGNIRIDAPS